jgi:hypothetical protein
LLFEEVSEPGPDLFGAAMLRAPPDLGQIIAVTIMRSMLHSAISGLKSWYAAMSANVKPRENIPWNEAFLVVENFRSGELHRAIR